MANDIFFYPDFVFCHNICYSRCKMKFWMHLLLCIMNFFKINFLKSILPSHQTRILGLKKETVSYYVANAYKLLIAHVTLIGWLFTNIFYLLFNTLDWSGTASYDFLPCSVILIPTIFTEVHLIHITENSHKIQKVQRASAVIHQQDTSIKIKWVVIYPA